MTHSVGSEKTDESLHVGKTDQTVIEGGKPLQIIGAHVGVQSPSSNPKEAIGVTGRHSSIGLDLADPPAHFNFHPGDVRSLRTGKKENGITNLLGLTKPFHRDLCENALGHCVHGFFGQPQPSIDRRRDGPGLTALTRIPRPTSSAAATRTRDRTAALLAE